MEDKELIIQTVQDLEDCKNKILERHSNNISICLRFGNVFDQLVNSLNLTTGSLKETNSNYTPEPITKFFGEQIKDKRRKPLKLQSIEVDEVEVFRAKVEMIYESFLTRENTDLIESLEPIEIRGVAKLAGVADFDSLKIDATFIETIKKAIVEKSKLKTKQETEVLKLSAKK